MPSVKPTSWFAIVMIGYALGTASACAGSQYPQGPAPQGPPGQADDPPARVGRLSYIEGPVSFLAASADSWAVAEPNRPVTTGDRLWSDNGARAEVEIGPNAVRLAGATEADVVRLTDHWLQVRIPQGTINERVRFLGADQDNEIDAPNAAVSLTEPGEYRVDVSPDGATTSITVWSGRAEVTAAGSSFPVEARQVATIRGDSSLTYDLTDAGAPGDFDRWTQDRDVRKDRATAALRYVSQDMPGTEDLDASGTWATEADYGPVWYPTVVEAGWAPYRQGHWVWVGRWGWTWVDEAPWGFAPYHYGRWAFVRGRWGWCPGRSIAEPVFAPALVVFVGGPTWRPVTEFGTGGGVAWFPLAPGEPYYPTYATDVGYRRRINVVNVTNITVVNSVTVVNYRNRDVPEAVTAVPSRVFVGSLPVRRAVVTVPHQDLFSAKVVTGAPVAPTHASFGAGVPGRRAPLPPSNLATRPAVATHAPPPAPVPFATQQRAIETNGGRPLSRAELGKLRPTGPTPVSPANPPIRSAEAVPTGPRAMTAARPGVPVTPEPATRVFAPRGPTTPAPVAPMAQPAARSPTAGPPAAGPPAAGPPAAGPPPARAPAAAPIPARPPASALDRSYQAERATVEARHRDEFAKPPAGESPAALSQRQEVEHQDLDQRYEKARASGESTMPPPPKAATRKPQEPGSKAPPKEPAGRRDRQ
jgi:hypothetical protein